MNIRNPTHPLPVQDPAVGSTPPEVRPDEEGDEEGNRALHQHAGGDNPHLDRDGSLRDHER